MHAAPLTSEQEEIHSLVLEHVLNQANIPVSFRLESPVVPFIGREAEKSELQWAHLDKKIVLLTGPRGIGKSELAKKYAQEIKVDNTSSTIWINSEGHLSFIDAMKDLATTVGINIENKNPTSIIQSVFEHFKNRKTLFIFDNAGDDNVLVNNLPVWIGSNPKFIRVIVTSRSENWDENKFKKIKINAFTPEESKEYIKSAISKEITIVTDDESCGKLAELLHNIPLALSGAVKDIIKHNSLSPDKVYTITDFIDSFNKKPIETTVITEVRGPTPEELEDAVSNKIKEEVQRVGDQITDEAKRFGHSVDKEFRRARDKVKKWFG